MPYCSCHNETSYNRTNRRKQNQEHVRKTEAPEEKVLLIHEPPVRDTPSKHVKPVGTFESSNSPQFPPPEPPYGDYASWDLQFCKWWGWTWVRKGEGPVIIDKPSGQVRVVHSTKPSQPCVQQEAGPSQGPETNAATQMQPTSYERTSPPPRRNRHAEARAARRANRAPPEDRRRSGGGSIFSCFQKQEEPGPIVHRPSDDSVTLRNPPRQTEQPAVVERPSAHTRQGETPPQQAEQQVESPPLRPFHDEFCCKCCYCGEDIRYSCMCCPHMHQECCCCGMSDMPPPSKTIQTQTAFCPVREQGTAISKVELREAQTQHRPPCGRQRCCRRQVCCSCLKNRCCPNAQLPKPVKNEPSCCNINTCPGPSVKKIYNNDACVNYCFTNNIKKPSLTDFKFKSSNFSTLHKCLDILLKNNMNITNLFNEDKKVLKKEEAAPDFLGDQISSLSLNNPIKTVDSEHSKLLTAVCDAIFSSHKIDVDKVHQLKMSTSKSTEKSCDSQESLSIIDKTTELDRLLKDLNFSFSGPKNDVDITFPKDTRMSGVDNPVHKKSERCFQPIKTSKLIKSKTRLLNISRIPRSKLNAKNYIDVAKSGGKNAKQSVQKTVENPKKKTNIIHPIETKLQFPIKFDFTPLPIDMSGISPPKQQGPSKFANVDRLLASIDFNLASGTFQETSEQNTSDKNEFLPSFLENKEDTLLEDTSPPFKDFELTFNSEDSAKETNLKDPRQFDP